MLNHVPVLYNECLSSLNIRPEGVYVDATLGLGGHSEGIAGRLTSGKLLSIDRDQSAIDRARERLSKAFHLRSLTTQNAGFHT